MKTYDQEIGGKKYRIEGLNAFEQLHIARRIAPIVHSGIFFAGAVAKSLVEYKKGNSEASDSSFVEACFSSKPFLIEFSRMPDEDLNFIIHTVLGHVMRDTGSGMARVSMNGQIMFDDMNIADILQIVIKVISEEIRPILTSFGFTDITDEVLTKMSQVG